MNVEKIQDPLAYSSASSSHKSVASYRDNLLSQWQLTRHIVYSAEGKPLTMILGLIGKLNYARYTCGNSHVHLHVHIHVVHACTCLQMSQVVTHYYKTNIGASLLWVLFKDHIVSSGSERKFSLHG